MDRSIIENQRSLSRKENGASEKKKKNTERRGHLQINGVIPSDLYFLRIYKNNKRAETTCEIEILHWEDTSPGCEIC